VRLAVQQLLDTAAFADCHPGQDVTRRVAMGLSSSTSPMRPKKSASTIPGISSGYRALLI
jgi:hypothetical protein